jgi:uncharacterized membrane protein YukC
MIVLVWILLILVVVLSYTTFNLLRKNEKQEDILKGYMTYLNKFSEIIDYSHKKLKEIDAKGSFESDDEVGFFFQQIKALQEILDTFNVKNL